MSRPRSKRMISQVGLVVERNSSADPNTLGVRIFDAAGSTVDTAQDDGFTVTVSC